jgi:hypothetical protein
MRLSCGNGVRVGCGMGLFTAVNRRLDEWVKVKQLDLSTVEGNEPDDGTGRKKDGKRKAEDVRSFTLFSFPRRPPLAAASLLLHKAC